MKVLGVVGLAVVLMVCSPSLAQSTYLADRVEQDSVAERSDRAGELESLSTAAKTVRALRQSISVDFEDLALEQALRRVASKADLQLSYGSQVVHGRDPVSLHHEQIAVHRVFEKLLESRELTLVVSASGHLVLTDPPGSSQGSHQTVQFEEEALRVELETMANRGFGSAYEPIQHPVSGTVTETRTGAPLEGVNVRVVGTTVGTATNEQGEYELEAPASTDTLQFTFVGYETQTVSIEGRSTVDVEMIPATLTGTEVVVTGYREQRRADLTGAVDVADVEAMQSQGFELVTQQIQGQLSGVSINTSGQPGDQPQINIRGFNTFGNNQPLFILDGVPTQDISHLNPQDVASLQVLKDAGSASQYGARASNGVIVITTRQGRGDVRVNYNASYGLQMREGNYVEMLSPQEQGELEWMAQRNSGIDNPSHPIWGDGDEPDVPEWILPARAENPNTDNYFVIPEYKDPDLLGDFQQFVRANQEGTDWFDATIDEPAGIMQHHVGASGGGDIGSFYTSVSYTGQQGLLKHTDFERYTARANSEFNLGDNFRIGENLTYSHSKNLLVEPGGNFRFMYQSHTIIPVRDIRGNFAGTQAPGLGTAGNPVAALERRRNDDQQTQRVFGNVFAEIDFLQDFTLRTDFGADLSTGFEESFQFPTYEEAQNNTTNRITKGTRTSQNLDWTSQITYDNEFGQNHDVSAVVAAEAIKESMLFEQFSRTDFFSFQDDFVQLGTGAGTPAVEESDEVANTLFSGVGNVDYSYANTYLLGLTVRRDGSSKFVNDQWGTFPAVSAGWRLSQVSFFENVDWVTDLKIRGEYGIMGNQLTVNPDNGFTLFGSSPQESFYPILGESNSVQQGIRRIRIGNPDATWERTKDFNFGLDFALLSGQLEGTVDYYQKEVEDMLFAPEQPATSGAAADPVQNVASMRNRGVDLSLRGRFGLTEALDLNGRLSFTSFVNEITGIAEGVGFFSPQVRTNFSLPVIRNEVGHPISSFYGFRVDGFWQSDNEIQQANQDAPSGTFQRDAAPGRFRYRDTDGDGEITLDDRVHIGDPHPDFSYGLDLNLTYGNWDFRVFLYGEQGKDIVNLRRVSYDFRSTFNTATRSATLHDSWSPDNRDAEVPIQELSQNFSTSTVPNEYFVDDASFLRLKNVRLGYSLPSSLYPQFGLQNLQLWVQARNLYTFTPYIGVNPDIGVTQAQSGDINPTRHGLDVGAFPASKTFTLGIDLSF